MNPELKKIIEPSILAGLIDADREELINEAQAKLEDDSLSFAEKICIAADMHTLLDSRSEIVKEDIDQKQQDRIK